jgi:hypothetical protein
MHFTPAVVAPVDWLAIDIWMIFRALAFWFAMILQHIFS